MYGKHLILYVLHIQLGFWKCAEIRIDSIVFRVLIAQGQKYLQVGGAQGQRYHNPCQYVAVLGLSCSMQDLLVVAWELSVAVCGIQGTRDQAQPPLHWECGALASGSPRKFLWPE